MMHKDEVSDTQENSLPEKQDHISDVSTEASVVQEENDDKGTVLDNPSTATTGEFNAEILNDSSEDSSSDSPSTRSKTTRQKNKNAKQEKDDVDSLKEEIQTELRHNNEVSETEITTNDVPTIIPDVLVYNQDQEPEETNTLDSSEDSGNIEYSEFPAENEQSENSQEFIIEEEISVTAISNEEISKSKSPHSEDISEKYSLSISSSELHQFSPSYNGNEKDEEHQPFMSENLSVTSSSCGGNIRSVSARRPVRKSFHWVAHGRSVCADRARTDESHSDTDCSVDTTESLYSSLKRKALKIDTVLCKKRKLNDSINSKFFLMVSSPLRMLRNKLSDRVVDSPKAHFMEHMANGNEDEDEYVDDEIQKENNDTKEKSLCVVSNEVSNQKKSLYQNWCSIM